MALGVEDEPDLKNYTSLLRELPQEYAGVRLTPSERRALVSTLKIASDSCGFQPSLKFALPTDDGGIATAELTVINNAPWLASRLKPGVVHLASPAIGAVLCDRLQLKQLTQVVLHELTEGFALADNCYDDARAVDLTQRLHSMDFAAACAAVLGAEAAKSSPSLLAPPRNLRTEAISSALSPYRISLVKSLRTRLVLAATREDVTLPSTANDEAPWFVDSKERMILLLASPQLAIPAEHLLGLAVCELLGCEAPASLAPLFTCPHTAIVSCLQSLRISPPDKWRKAAALGCAGAPCCAEDEAMMQLKPLRAYFTGEVVAIDASRLGLGDGFIYAELDQSLPTGSQTVSFEADARLALRVGSSRSIMHALPLHIHSFRTRRSFAHNPRVAPGTEVATADGDLVASGGASGARHKSEQPAGKGESSAELVAAVASVLQQAGVPVDLNTEQLLASNLRLKKELGQLRADLEARCIEISAAQQTIEANERCLVCQICFQRRVNVALQDCGHMLCSQCNLHMDRCPFCRGDLTGCTLLRW